MELNCKSKIFDDLFETRTDKELYKAKRKA